MHLKIFGEIELKYDQLYGLTIFFIFFHESKEVNEKQQKGKDYPILLMVLAKYESRPRESEI